MATVEDRYKAATTMFATRSPSSKRAASDTPSIPSRAPSSGTPAERRQPSRGTSLRDSTRVGSALRRMRNARRSPARPSCSRIASRRTCPARRRIGRAPTCTRAKSRTERRRRPMGRRSMRRQEKSGNGQRTRRHPRRTQLRVLASGSSSLARGFLGWKALDYLAARERARLQRAASSERRALNAALEHVADRRSRR